MTLIHPTAIIDPGAQLGNNVKVGPYCHIGGKVSLADDVELISHVSISGNTTVGKATKFFPFASIGHIPQDLKYNGEDSRLEIGSHNVIREYVTINLGTAHGGLVTHVGSHCLLMAGCHVAHDCHLGNHVIMANNVSLGGHVQIGDHTILGGHAAVHQFVRIGAHAMIGGMCGVSQDVIPYGILASEPAGLSGLNLIGLKRRGFSSATINSLREAYKALFSDDALNSASTFVERVIQLEAQFKNIEEVQYLIGFIRNSSHRNICMPKYAA
jgi:UDP-N-acetylglucosamine acyltransferase